MATRTTASVANLVKRRGTGGLSVDDFIWLQENKGAVKKVKDILLDFGDVAREAEQAAARLTSEAEQRMANAVAAEQALDDRVKASDAKTDVESAHIKDSADLVGRRLRDADVRVADADFRLAALDEREKRMDAIERDRETASHVADEDMTARNDAADDRDMVLQQSAADLEKRASTIKTAAAMLKQAEATLK